MKLVGLTGGIATGKSTVAAILRALGADIVDADQLAREIVRPGEPAWKEIVERFGKDALCADQTLDREKLRKLIFADDEARKALAAIMHPKIRDLATRRIRELADRGSQVIVYEAPLFFENQAQRWLRPVIVVACDAAVQERRLRERDRLNAEQIRQHLRAQMPLSEKRKLADYVIENNGSIEELEKRVREVWDKIPSISLAPGRFLPQDPPGRGRPPE
ncbi:MAG: dephospho-CoA kinase [Candidatus Binatia bacterium]